MRVGYRIDDVNDTVCYFIEPEAKNHKEAQEYVKLIEKALEEKDE